MTPRTIIFSVAAAAVALGLWFAELASNQIGCLDVESIGKPAALATRSDDAPAESQTELP
jgi:hypothetical protein